MKIRTASIAIIVPYGERVGGAYGYIKKLIECLTKYENNLKIHIICQQKVSISINKIYGDSKQITVYKYNDVNNYIRRIHDMLGYVPSENIEVLELLRKINPDVTMTTAPWDDGLRYWSCCRVVIVHDLFNWPINDSKISFFKGERDRGRKTIEMLALSDVVVCDSYITKEKILNIKKEYNLKDFDLHVTSLPPAFKSKINVDENIERPLNDSYWFVPSHITSLKNQIVVIEAIKIMKEMGRGDKVVFSFPTFSISYLIKILLNIFRYNLWAYVYFKYKASEAEMHKLYENCTGVILPTKIGPTNMPALEALEFGKPCIATYESVVGFQSEYEIRRFHSDSSAELASLMIAEGCNKKENTLIKSEKPSTFFNGNIEKLIDAILKRVYGK